MIILSGEFSAKVYNEDIFKPAEVCLISGCSGEQAVWWWPMLERDWQSVNRHHTGFMWRCSVLRI
jgi:hypothetical protein